MKVFPWELHLAETGLKLTNETLREVVRVTFDPKEDPEFFGLLFAKDTGLLRFSFALESAPAKGWLLLVRAIAENGEPTKQEVISRTDYGRILLFRSRDSWDTANRLYKKTVTEFFGENK